MYLQRTIEKEIPNLCKNFKVLLVSGMRQVGKTTTLSRLCEKNREYVTLDSFDDLELAEKYPTRFFDQHPLPVFVDEIQRVPKLFLQIKYEVDKKAKKGQVWLSGSQRFHLKKGVGDSLAGRIFCLDLMPLSIYELQGKGLQQEPYVPKFSKQPKLKALSVDKTWQTMWQGAWPEVINKNAKDREQFFNALINRFLESDIARLGSVENLSSFRRFLVALALRTGQELRINKIAELAGVTQITAKRWLSVAEASGIIFLLPPLFSNANKTLSKSPKIYFTDVGLAAYLCKKPNAEALISDMNSGSFFETFVVSEILKSWVHNGRQPDFYYFRDTKNPAEIDLIIQSDGVYYPIEIKSTTNPSLQMTKHFRILDKLGFKTGLGAVICNCSESRYLSKNVIAQSIWGI